MSSDETPDRDIRIGSSIAGRYRLDSVAGRGGMSVVYRATDTALGRTVAIKSLTNSIRSAENARRQESEVALLARLIHPALVVLFDVLDDPDGGSLLVMEYVDGISLSSAIAAGTSAGLDVARIGSDLAAALAYVHSQGIVHRDIKPANVLLPFDSAHGPTAKLADFGIARLVDAEGITATGLTIGTPAYLSPEQVRGTGAGAPSDIYGLGLVLLEALTGARAFEGTGAEVAMARLSADPEIGADIPAPLATILAAMTARDPDARPDAADVALRLDAIARGDVGTAGAARAGGAANTDGALTAGGAASAGGAATVADAGSAPGVDAATELMPTQSLPTQSMTDVFASEAPTSVLPTRDPSAATPPSEPTKILPAQSTAATRVLSTGEPGAIAAAAVPARRSRRGRILAVILLAVIVGGVAAFALSRGTAPAALPSGTPRPAASSATPKPVPSATAAAVVYPEVGGAIGSDLSALEASVSSTPSLQPAVQRVASLVAAGSFDEAKDALTSLEQKLDAALDSGDVTADQQRAIREAADAVRRDLDALTAPAGPNKPGKPGKGHGHGKGNTADQ